MRCSKLGPHNYSLHAEGRAVDWHVDVHDARDRADAERLIGLLLAPDRLGNPEALALEPAATEERFPEGEYFIFDVQAHFTNGRGPAFRNAEFMRNMGYQFRNDSESYAYPNFVQRNVLRQRDEHGRYLRRAGQGDHRDAQGRVPRREARTPGLPGRILPSWLMAERKTAAGGGGGRAGGRAA